MVLNQTVLLDLKHFKRWLDNSALQMKTKLGHEGKLSHRQLVRLGGLIAFVCDRLPYEHILDDLINSGFLIESGNSFEITSKGRYELTKLTAMAGLRPEHYGSK